MTVAQPNMWFVIDLMGRRVQPTRYTLRHYDSWDVEALRNWRFEVCTRRFALQHTHHTWIRRCGFACRVEFVMC